MAELLGNEKRATELLEEGQARAKARKEQRQGAWIVPGVGACSWGLALVAALT